MNEALHCRSEALKSLIADNLQTHNYVYTPLGVYVNFSVTTIEPRANRESLHPGLVSFSDLGDDSLRPSTKATSEDNPAKPKLTLRMNDGPKRE